MTLAPEQIAELKNQLKEQITHLPPDQKKEAESQIDSMSSKALETMLEQQRSQTPQPGQKTIFRMLVDEDVKSVKVGENAAAIAVFSVTPISKGHVLVIPKSAVSKPKQIPKGAFSLVREISEKVTENLKAKEARAETETQFGEAIVNVIPIYDKPLTASSLKGKATLDELKELKKQLETIRLEKKPEKIKVETKKTAPEKLLKLHKRIP